MFKIRVRGCRRNNHHYTVHISNCRADKFVFSFLNPCYYGTDISSREVLVAHNHSIEEIRKIIGVDSLGYLSIENVKQLAGDGCCDRFCTACFDGEYPTDIPVNSNKERFTKKLSEKGDK